MKSIEANAWNISTHILTKRMTLSHQERGRLLDISTHILTKRMTSVSGSLIRSSSYFNSHPHEEDDRCPGSQPKANRHFNSHPHEEDDGKTVPAAQRGGKISTHILTKRMTAQMKAQSTVAKFQLTSSRRG